MLKRISLIFCWIFILNAFIANSQCTQKATGNKKIGKNYMTFGQFSCALEEYLVIYQTKPDKPFVNRALAECYAGIPGMEKNAIKHIEFLVEKKKSTAQDLWILTFAYHKNEQFTKSIETANKYIAEFRPMDLELESIQILIGKCENAIELFKFPQKITFENLGKRINTPWDELNPMISNDEGKLIFTTTRKTVMGGYSFGNAFLPDLFMSKLKGAKYSNPRSLGSMFNSIDIDEYAGSSADSKYLFISTDSEGFQIYNLKVSHKGPRGRSFPKPVNLVGINDNASNERSATINNDGNIIIFSSDRPGGLGGLDLWISRKLPDGNWGVPVNLGPEVNTKLDECYAQFNYDQASIRFASQGHVNIGGYDLFESTFSDDYTTWSTPLNLGYPINTTHDDLTIQFLQNNRLAYKSDYRDDSYGMADLYRLVFSDSTPQLTVLNVMLRTDALTRLSIDSLNDIRDQSLNELDSLRFLLANIDSILKITPVLDATNNNQTVDGTEDQTASPHSIIIEVDSVMIAEATLLVGEKIEFLVEQITKQNEKITQTNPNCYAEIIVSNSDTEEEYGRYKSNSFRGGVLMIIEPGKYDLSVVADGYYSLNKSLVIFDKNRFKKIINKEYTLRKRK